MKDTSPDELVQTIHSVYADKLPIPQEFAQALFSSSTTVEVEPDSAQEDLTPHGLDVLKYTAQGMSNKQIAHTLSISTTTVRTQVSSMVRKLNLENRTQLAIYACKHDLAELVW